MSPYNRSQNLYWIILSYLIFIYFLCNQQTRAIASGGAGGTLSSQFFADQLTLSQPDGHIITTTLLRAPLSFQTLRQPCRLITKWKSAPYNRNRNSYSIMVDYLCKSHLIWIDFILKLEDKYETFFRDPLSSVFVDQKINVYIIGVSPSLVSRYCEGYSFWSIWGP